MLGEDGSGGAGGQWAHHQAPPKFKQVQWQTSAGQSWRTATTSLQYFYNSPAPLIKLDNHWKPKKNVSALQVAKKDAIDFDQDLVWKMKLVKQFEFINYQHGNMWEAGKGDVWIAEKSTWQCQNFAYTAPTINLRQWCQDCTLLCCMSSKKLKKATLGSDQWCNMGKNQWICLPHRCWLNPINLCIVQGIAAVPEFAVVAAALTSIEVQMGTYGCSVYGVPYNLFRKAYNGMV